MYDWNDAEIHTLLSHAHKSIDIIDSYYDEATTLAGWIAKAMENGAERLDINIYMCDPKYDFGAQRLIEKDNNARRKKRVFEDVKVEYERKFRSWCEELQDKLTQSPSIQKSQIALRIYKYSTMPSMRVIGVDDLDFVLGWFPLSDANPTYSCLMVSASSTSPGDIKFVERVRNQIKEVAKVSVEHMSGSGARSQKPKAAKSRM